MTQMRLPFFGIEAEPMPRSHLLQGDRDGACVVNCIVGVAGDGKHNVIVNPCGAIQNEIKPSVLVAPTPGWLQRIAVKVLHADQEPVLNHALAQFLDDPCHARVEDQVGQRITRTHPGDQSVGPFRVADMKESVGV